MGGGELQFSKELDGELYFSQENGTDLADASSEKVIPQGHNSCTHFQIVMRGNNKDILKNNKDIAFVPMKHGQIITQKWENERDSLPRHFLWWLMWVYLILGVYL